MKNDTRLPTSRSKDRTSTIGIEVLLRRLTADQSFPESRQFGRVNTENDHGAVHFPTHLILELSFFTVPVQPTS